MAAPAKALERVYDTSAPYPVGEMLRCLTCDAITDGSDMAFIEVLYYDPDHRPHGNWLWRNGEWLHLCQHYEANPSKTKIIDLWK